MDTHPIPGMIISPKEGVVPVGGTAELKVMLREPKIDLKGRGISMTNYWCTTSSNIVVCIFRAYNSC